MFLMVFEPERNAWNGILFRSVPFRFEPLFDAQSGTVEQPRLTFHFGLFHPKGIKKAPTCWSRLHFVIRLFLR